jgi:hypothetical protein
MRCMRLQWQHLFSKVDRYLLKAVDNDVQVDSCDVQDSQDSASLLSLSMLHTCNLISC